MGVRPINQNTMKNPQEIKSIQCTMCLKFHLEDEMWGEDWDDKQCIECYTLNHREEIKDIAIEQGCSVDDAIEIYQSY